MTTSSTARVFKGRDAELPVLANYLAFSLERDLADFQAYSPKFSAEYLAEFKAKTTEVAELLSPATETIRLRTVTNHLHQMQDSLIDSLNRLSGYLQLAKADLPLTVAQFGITALRKEIPTRDAEGTMKALRTVIANIESNLPTLQAQGLTDAFLQKLRDVLAAINADNQSQYEIMSMRKQLVQNNLGLLNALFNSIMEICLIGKVLYKATDQNKLTEYTYKELLKRVRLMLTKKTAEETNESVSS